MRLDKSHSLGTSREDETLARLVEELSRRIECGDRSGVGELLAQNNRRSRFPDQVAHIAVSELEVLVVADCCIPKFVPSLKTQWRLLRRERFILCTRSSVELLRNS